MTAITAKTNAYFNAKKWPNEPGMGPHQREESVPSGCKSR